MNKFKLNKSRKPAPIQIRQPPPALQQALNRIQRLMDTSNWHEAHRQLWNLERQYPNDYSLLQMFFESSLKTKDNVNLERSAVKLWELKSDDPQALFNVASVYFNNTRPILSLRTLEQFHERWPDNEHAAGVRQRIEELRPAVEKLVADFAMDADDKMEYAVRHEEAQSLLARGLYAEARQRAESVVKANPRFSPARNNISISYFYEGNLPKAIDASLSVLEFDADNVHALANLVHLYILSGRRDQAKDIAARLKESHARGWQRELKVAEAFHYVGDYGAVIDAYNRALADDHSSSLGPVLSHYAATAYCFLGQKVEARRLWESILPDQQAYDLAKQNLTDIGLPDAERHGPSAFTAVSWYTKPVFAAIREAAGQAENLSLEAAQRIYRRLLRQNPRIVDVAPLILELGDENAVSLLLSIVNLAEPAELIEPLIAFGIGHRGSDKLGMKAINMATSMGADVPGSVKI